MERGGTRTLAIMSAIPRTPPLGVGEDTKEDGKGKRWPRSAAKFYGISLAVLI